MWVAPLPLPLRGVLPPGGSSLLIAGPTVLIVQTQMASPLGTWLLGKPSSKQVGVSMLLLCLILACLILIAEGLAFSGLYFG